MAHLMEHIFLRTKADKDIRKDITLPIMERS
jgi:hypothetical protein